MWAARDEDGNLWFGGLTAICADMLAELPELLESSDPQVRERLLPNPYDEPDDQDCWRKYGTPELERLFLSRSQLVRRDLETLRPIPETDTWFLSIQANHESGWLAALNAARLTLFVLHSFTAEDMDADPTDQDAPERERALLQIHFLAEIQMALMEG